MMNEKLQSEIAEHGCAAYPREACGLIIVERGRERYIPCRNVAVGEESFVLPAADYAAAEERGEVVAVVHTHPDVPATPSQADRVACEASGLPWHIARVDGSVDGAGPVVTEWQSCKPCGYEAPLVGREFSHGVLDCYTLIRDWYRRERGIELPDFARRDRWWSDGSADDLYLANYGGAGFERLPDDAELREGDVIIMQMRSDKANHAGVYLGDGRILHHLYGRLSSRDVYGGQMLTNTRVRVRYRSEQ